MLNSPQDKNLMLRCGGHMFNSKKIQYLLLILIIFATGTPVGSHYYPQVTIIILITILALIILTKKTIAFEFNIIILFCFICVILLTTIFINQDHSFSHYTGIIMVLMIGYLISRSIPIKNFTGYFVNIMIVLSSISLICFLIGIIMPSIINRLPTFYMPETKQIFKHFMFLCNYGYSPDAKEIVTLHRNAGAFREAGVYELYLNFAIMLVLSKKGLKQYKVIFLFIITIITTASTIGIVSLIIIIFPHVITKVSKKHFLQKLIGVSVVVTFIGLEIIINFEKYFAKFSMSSTSYVSFQDRWFGTIQDLSLWMKSPLVGVGYNTFRKVSIGTANSFTCIMALYGIIFTAIIIIGLVMFVNKVSSKKMIFIFNITAVTLILFTQNLLLKPFIISFIFYGFSCSEIKNIHWRDKSMNKIIVTK
jgi:hypothetical protein